MDLVDEQNRCRAPRERVDHRLEPFLEIAAEPGAGEQRRRVEREHLRAAQLRRHVVLEQPARQPLGHGGLADTGIADEHRVVLAPPAENLERTLQLLGASDQRVELAACGTVGQIDGERRERVARRGGAIRPGARVGRFGRGAVARHGRYLRDAVRDVVQDVEPCDVLRLQQLRRVGVRLLENGREHVPEPDLVLAGALHVQDRSLQDPLEREGLVRFPATRAAGKLFEGAEKLVERMSERRQVAAARGQDLLTVGVVRQGVEQVLERQMRVPPRRGLPIGDVENQFERSAEHRLCHSSSSVACSGKPSCLARSWTVATLVSATS